MIKSTVGIYQWLIVDVAAGKRDGAGGVNETAKC